MPEPSADVLGEFVRAHAYARLHTLPEDERASWAKRCDALSRELGLDTPAPRGQTISAFAWRITMESLGELRSALQEGPDWLVERYAEEERRRLLAYAEAHVAVLRVLASGRSK